MYKKWSMLIVLTVIIMAFLLSACGTPETTKVTTTPGTTSVATTAVQPLTVKFGYTMPRVGVAVNLENYFTSISEKTNGRLKFEYYPMETLYTALQSVESLTKGITDIATVSPELLSKWFPATSVAGLANLNYPATLEAQLAASKALMALHQKFPAVQKEWKDMKVLWYMSSTSNVIYSIKKEIKVPSDLKGLKMGGFGSSLQVASTVGAVPVETSPMDSLMNMQTGIIDCYIANYGIGAIGLYESVKYVNDFSCGGAGLLVAMNWNTWNKISPADQKLIMDTVDEGNKACMQTSLGMDGFFLQKFAEFGGKINVAGPEWDGIATPQWDSWKAAAKAAGVENPDEILNYWKQMRDDFVKK